MTGFLTSVFERAKPVEKRSAAGYESLEYALGSVGGSTGVSVTQSSAMRSSAVFACVRVLAETVASLPLITYERQGNSRRRATDYYLYDLLHDRPNEMMTSFEFRETLQGHLALWGNAYCWIDYDERGRVSALWPLNPGNVYETKIQDGERWYQYMTPDGKVQWYRGVNIWHLRGLGSDGLNGYSPIGLLRQAIGLGMAAEEFGSRFFANDARPGIILEHPAKLSDDAYKNLKESWNAEHGGLSKSHKIAILEEGLKIHEVGIPPEDAQFLETRKFQVVEIARIYRIPPHMIGDLERATFSNIEHQSIDFVVHSIRPWLVRWEQSISHHLMLPSEREKYYAEHLVDGLLRGDTLSRYQAYQSGINAGWLTRADAREKENLEPIEGLDAPLVPLNMMEVGEGQSSSTETPRALRSELAMGDREQRARGMARGRHQLMRSYHRMFEDGAKRVLKREVQDVEAAARKYLRVRDMGQFTNWLESFYVEHKDWIFRVLKPLYASYMELVAENAAAEVGFEPDTSNLEAFVNSYLASYAGRHAGTSENKIKRALERAIENDVDQVEALIAELDTWVDVRSPVIANEESVRSNNAMAVALYQMAGSVAIMSVAFGHNCPYCDALDGKIIGIDNFFITSGNDFQPEGAERPLTSADNLRHAPYHGGCDCMTIAA